MNVPGAGSAVDAVDGEIPGLLAEFPSMPATVIAERIGWTHGMTILKERVRELRPLFVLAAPSSYTTLMGFRISDVWKPGADDIVFTHCNARHHSLALVGIPESTPYHFMLEARTLDGVGYTLDRHATGGTPYRSDSASTPTTTRCPSRAGAHQGSMWSSAAGLRIDDATWTVSPITKPSFWGTPSANRRIERRSRVVPPMPISPRPSVLSAGSRGAQEPRPRRHDRTAAYITSTSRSAP